MTTPITPEQTQLELNHVLKSIRRSRFQLVRVIDHLKRLREMERARVRQIQSSSLRWSVASSSSSTSSSTISEAMPKTPEEKPKTIADMLTQFGLKRKRSMTHYEGIPIELILPPPAVAPKDRQLVSSRRMKQLDRAMAALCTEKQQVKDVEMSEEDDEDESDSDDDDDDDLVIIR